jgi:hypothetical protein
MRRALFVLAVVLAFTPPLPADEAGGHLFLGNPSGADRAKRDNFLLRKPQYVLPYNNGKGTPNWVGWRLSRSWLGKTRRGNPFAPKAFSSSTPPTTGPAGSTGATCVRPPSGGQV